MRYLFAALSFALLLSGCATDAEDRAFFNDGWVHPEEGADRRLMGPGVNSAPAEPVPVDPADRHREGL